MPPGRLIILRRSKSRAQTISSWKITSRAGARRISLPIAVQHAVRVGRLPDVHRDPFDGMLVAQNRVEELRLITHNRCSSVTISAPKACHRFFLLKGGPPKASPVGRRNGSEIVEP